MALIIPGVEVKVVKEVLSPQLAPSGVLGLIGLTEKSPKSGIGRTQSWSHFIELFGASSAYSMPEVAQALANGVSELVIVPVKSTTTASASASASKTSGLTFKAKASGTWANNLCIDIQKRGIAYELSLYRKEQKDKPLEIHRNMVLSSSTDADCIVTRLNSYSQYISASGQISDSTNITSTIELSGGKDASPDDYIKALRQLENESDVDLVLTSVGGINDTNNLSKIYTAINSHCNKMSSKSQGRIGFAQVSGDDETTITTNAKTLAENLISDRLVLIAPNKAAGAVVGMIGSLEYFQSPTFKPISLDGIKPRLGVEAQEALLKQNIVPIVNYRGRGIIVVRGLTSDGDQINVRRTADHAVRGVKAIGECFIGRLNNDEGRGALQQNLTAFLLQMEKDGALVPSTDGSDPAFKVNVYSSQQDFSQGIVRVEMAVRPVRAIDYIYATVTVQV